MLQNYRTSDFSEREINQTIDSAYAQTQNFGTKYYEDEERVNNIRVKLRRGASKSEVRKQLEDSDIENVVIESVLNRVEEENQQKQFWTKSDKGVIKIVHILFKQFLEDNGFYKYCPEGSKNYVFVKVTNNLVDHTDEKQIKDFVLNNIIDLDDASVYNHFADQVRYFRTKHTQHLSLIHI